LLDLGLPDIDGLSVIEAVRRESAVPIIVSSSRSDEQGKVQALDLGADDYVTKPFGMEELVARITTALRHRFQQRGERPVFVSGDLAVDLARRVVKLRSEEVKLSPKEYDILSLLVAHAGKVLTRRFILREVWKTETDVQYLRIYIKQLRQKIEQDPQQPRHILTETGAGVHTRPAAFAIWSRFTMSRCSACWPRVRRAPRPSAAARSRCRQASGRRPCARRAAVC
jgi:two-component system, OmpR family, KDP operon response regulator KdpE